MCSVGFMDRAATAAARFVHLPLASLFVLPFSFSPSPSLSPHTLSFSFSLHHSRYPALLGLGISLPGTVANSLAGALAGVWDVSNDALGRHDYDGMWKLTLLCGCVQLGGLAFLGLLPSGVNEQVALQASDSSSKAAGSLFLTVVFVSLSFVIGFTLVTILAPDIAPPTPVVKFSSMALNA